MKRVQWAWRVMDRKNDDHVANVLKKSFEFTKMLSARAKEIKAAKKVKFIQDCCGLWRRKAMQCATLYWLGGRPSCLECVRARICTELKSVLRPEKIQHCYENWLWPVNALRGLIYTRITKKPFAVRNHSKLSTTTDAAAGLSASGTKKLRRGHGRRAHYRFLRASCPVWRVVAWRLVTLVGLPTEGSCVLNWGVEISCY
jgi:hypothetical protein